MEKQKTCGVERVAPQLGVSSHNLASVGQREPGGILKNERLELAVGLLTFLLIQLFPRLTDQLVHLRVRVKQDIGTAHCLVDIRAAENEAEMLLSDSY